MSEPADPLILTLRLDERSFARFDAERRRHFPPGRNKIPAHLTLFHHLPGDCLDDIAATLARSAAHQEPFALQIVSLRFLGQGTAYQIESAELTRLRAGFAQCWSSNLTRQDTQGYRPHITIQNKASPLAARRLFEDLTAAFEPFTATATGWLLWHYRGGPWEPAGEFAFAAGTDAASEASPIAFERR